MVQCAQQTAKRAPGTPLPYNSLLCESRTLRSVLFCGLTWGLDILQVTVKCEGASAPKAPSGRELPTKSGEGECGSSSNIYFIGRDTPSTADAVPLPRRGRLLVPDMGRHTPSVTACAVPPPLTQGRLLTRPRFLISFTRLVKPCALCYNGSWRIICRKEPP